MALLYPSTRAFILRGFAIFESARVHSNNTMAAAVSFRWLLQPLWRIVHDYAPEYARPAYAGALPEFAAVHVPSVGRGAFRGVPINIAEGAIDDGDVPVLDWAFNHRYTSDDEVSRTVAEWSLETIKYVANRGMSLSARMFSGAVKRGDLRALQWLARYSCPVGEGEGPADLESAKLCFKLGYQPRTLSRKSLKDLPLFRFMVETYKFARLDDVFGEASPEVIEWIRQNVDSAKYPEMKNNLTESSTDEVRRAAFAALVAAAAGDIKKPNPEAGRDKISYKLYNNSHGLALSALFRGDLQSLKILKQKNLIPPPPGKVTKAELKGDDHVYRFHYIDVVAEAFFIAVRDDNRELLNWLIANGFDEWPLIGLRLIQRNDLGVLRWVESQGLLGQLKKLDYSKLSWYPSSVEMVDWALDRGFVPPAEAYSLFCGDSNTARMVSRFDQLHAHGCPIVLDVFAGGGRAVLDWLEHKHKAGSGAIMDYAIQHNNVVWLLWAAERPCLVMPPMSRLFKYEAWDVLDRVLVLEPALAVPAWEYLKKVGAGMNIGPFVPVVVPSFVPTVVINLIREHVDKAHSDGGVPIYGVECSYVRNEEGADDIEADDIEEDYPREEDD